MEDFVFVAILILVGLAFYYSIRIERKSRQVGYDVEQLRLRFIQTINELPPEDIVDWEIETNYSNKLKAVKGYVLIVVATRNSYEKALKLVEDWPEHWVTDIQLHKGENYEI